MNTDEILRQQLDRRGRVYTMQEKNNREITYSNAKVNDVRSRSPQRKDTGQQSPSRSRGFGNNSPLRSSYKASYNY